MKGILKRYFFLILIFLFIIILTSPAKRALGYWQHFDPNNTNQSLPSSRIYSLVMDPNRLWIGTDQGLVEYNLLLDDPIAGWTIHTKIDPEDYAPVTAMDIDNDGLLWLGTPHGLVSYEPDNQDTNNLLLHEGLEFINPDQLLAIAANPNFVWVATDKGLNRFDKSGNWILYHNDPDGFYSFTARAVDSRENDNIWVLPSLFGVYRYTLSSDQWDYFSTMTGPFEIVFNSIIIGENNDIWLGSSTFGLWRFEPDSSLWTHWEKGEYDLPSEYIQAIGMYRGSNRIILATGNGIARYDLDLALWQPIGIPTSLDLGSQIITDILVDPNRHQVWFGTENGGLYRWKEGSIIWSNPANDSRNVSLDMDSVEVVFNDRIDPDTVELGTLSPSSLIISMLDTNLNPIVDPNIFDPDNFDPNSFTLRWRDPNTYTHLIIEPNYKLFPNIWYRFRFTPAIRDYSGNPIPNIDNELLFKTLLPPSVVDTDPKHNAINIDLDAQIKIWFNKLMDPNSFFGFPSNLQIDPPTSPPKGIVKHETEFQDTNNQTLLTITIPGQFNPGSQYTIIVSSNVKDLSGNSLSEIFSFTFITQTGPQIIFQPGKSPMPGLDAIDVSWDTDIAVTFNMTMARDSVEASFTLNPSVTGAFFWLYSDTTVVFQPDNDLAPGTTYQVTIDTNARDINGIPLGLPYTWSFTTLFDPNDLVPSIESVLPAEDEDFASIYTKIEAGFSRAMNKTSVEGAFKLLDDQNAVVAGSFQWSLDSTEFRFAPNDPLDPGHTYRASIAASAESESGYSLEQAKTWEFTAILPETIPSGWPLFDMGMDPNSISVTAMALNPADRGIWVGLASVDTNSNWAGLGLFHYDGVEWKQYTRSDPSCGLTSDSINDLAFDSQGNLWIAAEPDPNGSGGGVNMFDGQEWHSYSPEDDPDKFYIMDRGGLLPSDIQDFFNVNAIDVYSGTEETIWIATTGGIGIGRYNAGTGDWEWSAKADPTLLYLLAVDSSTGTIWIESGNPIWEPDEPCKAVAGLDAEDLIQKFGLWPDVWDQNIWVWSPNGGFPKIRLLGEVHPNLRAMTADGHNNLWLGTKDGLYRISIDSLLLGVCDYELYDHLETGGGLLYDSIYDLTLNLDDPNQLWVAMADPSGSGGGISALDLTESTQQHIKSPASWTRYPLTDILVLKMLPTANDVVYAGTDKGLMIIGGTVPVSWISSTDPEQGEQSVPVSGLTIQVNFTRAMDQNTTEAAFCLQAGTNYNPGGSCVDGSFDWSTGNKGLVFYPTGALSGGTNYVLTIGAINTATDPNGVSMPEPFTLKFTTASVPEGWIESIYPKAGDQSVPVSGFTIRVNFTRAMDPNTTEAAFCLQAGTDYNPDNPCVEGTFVWLPNHVLIFSPAEALSGGTTYVLTIGIINTARDLDGDPMPPLILSFTAVNKLTFKGVGCFIQGVEYEKADIFESFKDWLHFNP